MFSHLIFSLLCFLAFHSVFSNDQICTSTNCQLPCCQCAISNNNPTKFNTTDIPQLVLLTFVGNLNTHTFSSIRSILNPIYRNPNKCPISATFFINDNYTEYCYVQRLFNNHNEIAMTTSSNKCPISNCDEENSWRRWIENDWTREIKQQRLNLIEKSSIHQSHIKGFRVPHFQIDQDRHLELIRNYHFHYDSSMLFHSSNFIWPFTMNYLFNKTDCLNCDENNRTIDALWQFPLHEWTYPNATTSCWTFSNASCLPEDEIHSIDLYYDFLKYNFDRHTSLTLGHRSPFIIELDLMWLSEHQDKRLEALIRFIENILSSDDHRYVYFVSIEQALEWLKYPRTLDQLDDFWAFSCSDITYEYDIECSDDESDIFRRRDDAKKLIGKNQSNNSESEIQSRQAEELFRSGIVLHSTWIFILLILSVLFYDHYFVNK